jgi:predicted lipoprotein with Yx(FWY)xxD motif
MNMSSNQIRRVATGALAAVGVASFAVAASLADAAGAEPPAMGTTLASVASAGPAKIDVRSTSLGKVLVNGSGFTLFAFSRDAKRRDKCATTKGCMHVWPVAASHGRPEAGRGVKASQLGTITLRGGVRQVTYFGHPLYTYSFDTAPGQTDYVGAKQFGGTWRAVRASGQLTG